MIAARFLHKRSGLRENPQFARKRVLRIAGARMLVESRRHDRDGDMTRRMADPRHAAEAAFKAATTKPPEPDPKPKTSSLPNAKEMVSLRLDRDVLDHFQEDGPGWQDRINDALRKAAGK